MPQHHDQNAAEKQPIRILHRLSLSHRTWGGVEEQFSNYVSATRDDPRLENYLTRTNRTLHRNVADLAECLAGPPFDGKHRLGLPAPASLMTRLEARQARRWNIDVVLNTNRLGDGRTVRVAEACSAAPVYWERGAAWIAKAQSLDPRFAKGHALVIANSQASRRMLRDVWRMEGPIEICCPCVWDAALQDLGEGRALNGPTLRLGFAARLRAFKGGVIAVHVLHELAGLGIDARLVVAGDGPDGARMRSVAERIGVGGRIDWLGDVRSMHAFYRDIDILLHPALREPYGNVCAEASLAGVPVVATCVDGLPEVIECGVTGLCVPVSLTMDQFEELGGDTSDLYPLVYRPDLDQVAPPGAASPSDLAGAVVAIAGTPETYGVYSARALATARRNFLPDAHIDRFVALMERAAAAR